MILYEEDFNLNDPFDLWVCDTRTDDGSPDENTKC